MFFPARRSIKRLSSITSDFGASISISHLIGFVTVLFDYRCSSQAAIQYELENISVMFPFSHREKESRSSLLATSALIRPFLEVAATL